MDVAADYPVRHGIRLPSFGFAEPWPRAIVVAALEVLGTLLHRMKWETKESTKAAGSKKTTASTNIRPPSVTPPAAGEPY